MKKKKPSHSGLKTSLWPFGNHLSWRQKCVFPDWLVSGYLWSVAVAVGKNFFMIGLVASRFRCSPTAYMEHADLFTLTSCSPGSSETVKSMAQTGNRKLLQNNVCYNTEGQLLIWRWTFSTSSLCRFFWQIVSNCLQTSHRLPGKLRVTMANC